jgi:hypothetical protein
MLLKLLYNFCRSVTQRFGLADHTAEPPAIVVYAKRLEKGRFIWPSPANAVLGISAPQLAYMLDGIDRRNPRHTFRPERAG